MDKEEQMSKVVLSDYLKRQMEWMCEAVDNVIGSSMPEEIKEQLITEYVAKWKAYTEMRNFILTYYLEECNEEDTDKFEHR